MKLSEMYKEKQMKSLSNKITGKMIYQCEN